MVVIMFLILSLVTGGHGLQRECTVEEQREMQSKFSSCSRDVSSASVCQLVQNVVDNCGEHWRDCHEDREVRQLKDLHIEEMVRLYGRGQDLTYCPVVKEFRESGRTTAEEVLCSDTKTLEIQKQFQKCSHEISTAVYEASLELTSPRVITTKLCKALGDIGSVCVKHLRQCFASEDVRQMRRSNMQEMKEFLIRIVDGKVTSDALDTCKALVQVNYNREEEVISIPVTQKQDEVTTTQTTVMVAVRPQSSTTAKSLEVVEVQETVKNLETSALNQVENVIEEKLEEVTEKKNEEVTEKVKEVTQKIEEVQKNREATVAASPQHVKRRLQVEGSGAESRKSLSLMVLILSLMLRFGMSLY